MKTERLILRRWLDRDRMPFAAMGRDPDVMRHFPTLLTRAASDAMIDERIEAHFDRHGFGLWALERKCDGRFLGFAGLMRIGFSCPIEGEVEIGWRLARHAWGEGYAREAATAALDQAFFGLDLPRVVAMTVAGNRRSWGLMQRLGMERAERLDFDHPRIEEGSPVRPQIVYTIDSSAWVGPS